MSNDKDLKIAVFPGDGIGPEVMDVPQAVLAAAQDKVGGFRLINDHHDSGGSDGTNKVAKTLIELLRAG